MKLIDMLTSPWAIRRDKLSGIIDIMDTHQKGPKLDLKEMELQMSKFTPAAEGLYEIIDKTAIINITGVLSKSVSAFQRVLFGGMGTSDIKNAFIDAVENSEVDEIILYIDSPGGTVDGTQELADAIFERRGEKPVKAYSDGMICSAAYWIAAAADKIIISGDTVDVGSIGVYRTHVDFSNMDKKYGIKVTEIFAGKYKVAGSPNKPLSKEDAEYLQDGVNYLYSIFISEVAKMRGVSEEKVLSDMADGRVFIGKQAIDAGLVDGVSTLDRLINKTGNIDSNSDSAQSGVDGAKAIESENKSTNKEDWSMEITIQSLEKDHPEIFNQVKKLGEAEAGKDIGDMDERIETARQEATTAELQRIKDVAAQSLPGHEALIQGLMFDGKTTGAEAAVKVLEAENKNREKMKADFQNDGTPKVPSTESSDSKKPEGSSDGPDNRPLAEQAKDEWEKDPEIRSEYGDSEEGFKSFLSYKEAVEQGKARIKGGAK